MANFSATLLAAAKKSMFSSSEWKPFGDPVALKDLWDVTNPGLYKEIEGDVAEVTTAEFADGSTGYRITIPFKDGSTIDLKLSGKSDLDEGDKVKISTIMGQELHKVGQDPILRYDAELVDED